ncbi:uncharacterized protein [Diadema setosum]|uniref:uncharacterized protein n=1 Tax=Diadema setosum TaxID=31175 RepID=UPI003B3BD04C
MRVGKKIDIVFTWFLANITLLAGTLTTFLDIEELKSVHYDIDILEKPVLYGRPLHTEVVYLSSKYGQRYECQIPDVGDVGKVQEEEKTAAEAGISELLKPMESAPCLTKTKDWWTYEFCYGKYVRQFHLDNNEISGDVIMLGIFESEMDWANKSHSDAKRHRLNRYHSHRYGNGSKCDLTGKPREAEVRFMCAENQLDSVSRIDEPESCRYIITVHTMRICHHPYLKPPPKATPKTVLCFPLLMQDQYEQYMHQQASKKYSREAQELVDESDDGDVEDDLTEEDEGGEMSGIQENQDLELLEEHHLTMTEGDDAISSPSTGKAALQDLVGTILKGVQGSLEDIESEIGEGKVTAHHSVDQAERDESPPGQASKGEEDRSDDEDDDTEDEDEDEEMERLLKKDYKELTEMVLALADGEAEAQRIEGILKDIETSFENLEMMDDFLEELQTQMEEKGAAVGAADEEEVIEEESPETPGEEMGDADSSMNSEGALRGVDGEDNVVDNKGVKGEREEEEKDEEEGEEKKTVEQHLIDTINKMIKNVKDKEVPTEQAAEKASTNPAGSQTKGDLSNRVRVRVTRVKLDKNQKASSEKELKFLDTEHRDLEEAISDQLEKSGLTTEGAGQLELRVLSYIPEDWPDQGDEEEGFAILSEEDSNYFKNMIFGLVTRSDNQEEIRQERLLQNYGFRWNADHDDDQYSLADQMEDDYSQAEILVPPVGPKEYVQGQDQQVSRDPED